MPRPIIVVLVFLVLLSFVPLAYFYLARQTDSPRPRLQVVWDMDDQARFGAQAPSTSGALPGRKRQRKGLRAMRNRTWEMRRQAWLVSPNVFSLR